jgi:hypothetical protein
MNIFEPEIGRVFYKPEPDIGGSSFTVRHPTLRETLFRADLMMTYIDKRYTKHFQMRTKEFLG